MEGRTVMTPDPKSPEATDSASCFLQAQRAYYDALLKTAAESRRPRTDWIRDPETEAVNAAAAIIDQFIGSALTRERTTREQAEAEARRLRGCVGDCKALLFDLMQYPKASAYPDGPCLHASDFQEVRTLSQKIAALEQPAGEAQKGGGL